MNVSDERGATLVEQAIILPVLIIMVVAAAELLRLSYIAVTVQFSVPRVMRDAVIGPQIFTQGYASYEQYLFGEIEKRAGFFGVDLEDANFQVTCPDATDSDCGDTAGVPGALVSVRVTTPVSVLFVGEFTVRGVSVARNEWW